MINLPLPLRKGSAPYIAKFGRDSHLYIPGEWLHKPNKLFDSFLQDVALSFTVDGHEDGLK
jgi:hypothetical protein